MSDDRRKKKSDRRQRQFGAPGGEEQRIGERRRAREAKGMAFFYMSLWLLVFIVPGGAAGAYYYLNKDKECHYFKPITMQTRLDGEKFCQSMTQERSQDFQGSSEDWGFIYIGTKCLGGKLVHECKRYRQNSNF
jgi:hypothetical protein